MKSPTRATVLVVAILLSGAIGADDNPRPLVETPVVLDVDNARDWAQTRLIPKPTLREQIRRTQAFLDENTARINGEIFRLKTEGILDRRNASKVRNALDHALRSMTQVNEGIEAEVPIDGWTARMISYDLGMVADTLIGQADLIEAAQNTGAKDAAGESDEPFSQWGQLHLVKTLREGSSLLKETARAIVRYLE